MITSALEKYKVSTTKQAVTSYAGLPLLLGMAKSLGLEKKLNELGVKARARGYKPAEAMFSSMGLLPLPLSNTATLVGLFITHISFSHPKWEKEIPFRRSPPTYG